MADRICYDKNVARARAGQMAMVRGAFHPATEASSLRKLASVKV
jgi:hypothetical protein